MNKSLLFLLLVCQLIPRLSTAQDWSIVQRDPSLSITDLCFLDDELHGFAIGSAAGPGSNLTRIYQTSDGGDHWLAMNFPINNAVAMSGISFVSPLIGWVVGANGLIFKTVNGGASWSSQASGLAANLVKVQFINDQEGWATAGANSGAAFVVLKTTNGGATWQNLSFGNDAYASNSMFFLDAQHGWIAGFNNQLLPRIFYTENGGNSWVSQNLPVSAQGTQISSVKFATSLIGWATVNSLYEPVAGPVLHTMDGGAHWDIQYFTNQHYNQLDVKDVDHVAVVGVSILSPSSTKLFVTENGGQNWSSKLAPITDYTNAIHYGDSKIWMGANKSIILSTPDNGANWTWEHYSPWIRSMAWVSDQLGWATCGTNVGTDHWTYKTTDGGVHWEVDPIAPGGADVTFVDANHGWMLWQGNQPKVWGTVNGGGSWTSYPIPSGGKWIEGICFPTKDKGWAFGDGTLKYTQNAGLTWTNQNVGSSKFIEKVFFVNESEGWAGGGYGGSSGFISHTTNGGATWTLQSYPSSDHVVDICFLDNQRGWVSTAVGTVFKTIDGGVHWNQVGSASAFQATNILMANDLEGWLIEFTAGGSQLGNIYRTSDGGLSWLPDWAGDWPQMFLTNLSLQPGFYTHVWAMGNHNTLLKYDQTVAVHPVAEDITGLRVNPNPISDLAIIRYSLLEAQPVNLRVYDLSGREIALLLQEDQMAGEHIFVWDVAAQNLAPGLYLLTIKAEQGSKTIKVMVQ